MPIWQVPKNKIRDQQRHMEYISTKHKTGDVVASTFNLAYQPTRAWIEGPTRPHPQPILSVRDVPAGPG